MKKLLGLIGTIAIVGNTLSTVIITSFYEKQEQHKLESSQINYLKNKDNFNSKKEYKVNIIGKKQEKEDWCGIASLQAIYEALVKKEISQKEIAKVIKKDDKIWGIDALKIILFLDKFSLLTNTKYKQKAFDVGFGNEQKELLQFQNYIKNSLINGAPILFNFYFNDEATRTKSGHTMLIYKVEIDEQKPLNTNYFIWDPEDDSNRSSNASLFISTLYKQYPGDIFVGKKIDKNNKMKAKINYNWKKIGPITNDSITEGKTIPLIKWSYYADSWEEFKHVYKSFKFKKFVASAGGQGDTVSNNKFQANTVDIQNEGKTYDLHEKGFLVKYEYVTLIPAVLFWPTNQKASLRINSFFIKGEYLYMDVISYTHSEVAYYHSWTELKLGGIEFYRQ